MTVPPSAPDAGEPAAGLLLLRGSPADVSAWARRGVVPVTVGRLEGWTALLPRGHGSLAAPPYDRALPLLAARPVPARLGPALGFWSIGERGVITVQVGRRSRVRWVVWEREHGVVRPEGLLTATPGDLLRAAKGGSRAELVEILSERHIAPERILAAAVAVLGLPGARLLVSPHERESLLPGAVERDPDEQQVRWFDDAVRDSVRLRQELEA